VPDQASVLKNLDEIGWNVPTVHSGTLLALYKPVLAAAGPEAMKHVTGAVQVKAFTYCSGDAIGSSPYAKFLERLKADNPSNFQQIATNVAVWTYDSVMVAKAAAEGAGTTDGRKMAAWLETHTVAGIAGTAHGSPQSHFLGNADTSTVIEDPTSVRSDGLTKRSGC
jgi:hypothetical protein